MASRAAHSLKRRLLLLFVGIYILALVLLISGNLTVYQNSVTELTGFWALEMLALGIIFILPGYLVSCRLLRPLLRWLDGSIGSPNQAGAVHQAGTAGEAAAGKDGVTGGAGSAGSSTHLIAAAAQPGSEPAAAARRAAFRYPWQALLFFAAFGIVGSGLFHLSETWHELGGAASASGWWEVTLPTYLSEFSLSIALGIVHFVASRRLLRPFLLLLPPPHSRDVRRFSLRNRILVTILALAFTSTVPLLTAYLNSFYFHKVINGWGLMVIVLQALLLSGAVGLLAASDTATDLTFLTRELNALAHAQRTGLRRPLAPVSDDETGDLVLAFNALQARAAADDWELEQELELAWRVQAELLPHQIPATGG
ncbi:MAG: phosphoserine phosphatase RsbU/P [Clostridia bacterium]|nr:phosphoserine phosphatase RsbU/P [Clostridia bacterium]